MRLTSRSLCTLAAAAILGTAACRNSTIYDDYSGVDVVIVDAIPLFTGVNVSYSGLTDSATYAIRTNAEWTALWAKATSGQQPAPPVPVVDFSKNMVLLVAMGTRGTGGYGVTIDHVTDGGAGERIVESTLTHPVNCVVTQALTAPFAAVLAPASTVPVRFVNRSAEHRCS
jgi:PrcB C-terminal